MLECEMYGPPVRMELNHSAATCGYVPYVTVWVSSYNAILLDVALIQSTNPPLTA